MLSTKLPAAAARVVPLWALLFILIWIPTLTSGQSCTATPYTPIIMPTIRKLNHSQTNGLDQTNFCPRQLQVFNKSSGVSFNCALQGLTINLGLRQANQTDAAWVSYDPVTGMPDGGFFYEAWMALASAGGFNIQWVMPPLQPDWQSFTQHLQATTPHMDFYMGTWLSDTTTRRRLREGFLPIVDASLVLIVAQQVIEDRYKNYWHFAEPFANQLWGVLVALLIANGFILWFISRVQAQEDKVLQRLDGEENETASVSAKSESSTGSTLKWVEGRETTNFMEIMYRSVLSFPVNGRFRAGSYKTMLINLVFTFVLLILASTYIAKLTESLIIAAKPAVTLTSIDEANSKASSICIERGAIAVSYIQANYPSIKLKQYDSPDHIRNVALGNCDGGVAANIDFLAALGRKYENPNCNLVKGQSYIKKKRSCPLISSNVIIFERVGFSYFFASCLELVLRSIDRPSFF
jgi:hypothetical protein